MIFNTWARFHAAADIDAERLNPANRFGDIVDPQPARKHNIRRIDPYEPFPREHLPRAAIPGGKRIEQIVIRREAFQGSEGSLLFDAKSLDYLQIPASTVDAVFFPVKLQAAIALPSIWQLARRQYFLDACSGLVNEQRDVEYIPRKALNDFLASSGAMQRGLGG